ncbi:hypothetical protein [Treponema endosymbiont of Eucomonympha sp.]|uniref:hypothetical protein n=1 Tax=Treponema endosymbiont of Eucomonympha sp. TaxID=1580831 RepID=UPI00075162D2|nr:hypothetical protein [Treponema endosymbiont of Eucomonympha sp.]
MAAEQAATPEKVTLDDLYRYLAESRKEWDEKMAESRNEWNRKMAEERQAREEAAKERDEEMAESRKEWNEKMGDLGNRLGDVVEYTFVPDAVMRKFAELGYEIETAARDYTITGADRHSIAEVDILLQDGDTVILVEIKTKLTKAHIDEHIQRMQKVRETKRFEGKALIGAAAGAVVSGETKTYALQQGMYVLEQTGEAIQIVPRDRSFVPRKW